MNNDITETGVVLAQDYAEVPPHENDTVEEPPIEEPLIEEPPISAERVHIPLTQRVWFIALMFILFWPLGLALLCRSPHVAKGAKVTLILAVVVLPLVIVSLPVMSLAVPVFRVIEKDGPASVISSLRGHATGVPAVVAMSGTVVVGGMDGWVPLTDGRVGLVDLDVTGDGDTPQSYMPATSATYSVNGETVTSKQMGHVLRDSSTQRFIVSLAGVDKGGTFRHAGFIATP